MFQCRGGVKQVLRRIADSCSTWSIRTKLILVFAAITVIPIVALSYYVSMEFTRELEQEMTEASNRQIAQVETAISNFLNSQRESVEELVLDPLLQNVDDSVTTYINKQGDADGLVKMLIPQTRGIETEIYRRFFIHRTFNRNISMVSLSVESNGGYIQSPATTCIAHYDPRKQDWYKAAMKQPGRVRMVDAHLAADGSSILIGFAKAVVDDFGSVKGVLSVEISLPRLTALVYDYQWGRYGHVILTDEQGKILADPLRPERVSQNIREIYSGVPENLKDIRAGTINAKADGREILLTVHSSGQAAWMIVGIADKTDLFDTAAKLRRTIQIAAFIMMLFAVALGAFLSRRISTPIREVVAAAESIAAGDLAAPQRLKLSGSRKDEIGRLEHSIVMMAAAIERSFREREEYYRLIHEQDQKVAEELRRLDRLKDDLLATVSHELKTPLHGIIGLADSLSERLAGSRNKLTISNLNLIAGSGKRLVSLVNDIMDFVTLRGSQVRLKLRPVRVHDCVQGVMTLCQALKKAPKVVLENRVPETLPPVYADGDRLTQILHNLIGNAMKFTETGTISIGAVQQDDSIQITVTDTGSGIPADKLALIFEPFEKIEFAGRKSGGIGLGLSIVKNLVELHGGKITVASEPGRGSQFTVSLPIWKGESEEPFVFLPPENLVPHDVIRPVEDTGPVQTAFSNGVESVKILVVDDDEVNLTVVENYLTDDKYSLKCVESGNAALLELVDNKYDLVLLDVMMPGLNGLDTCREIRKSKNGILLPIIMLTVRNSPEDISAAFTAGANDYITKPFYKKELVARIEAQLSVRGRYLAEVRALQAQIRPHFFYNALNTIANQCRKDPAKARDLLIHLGTYLQKCFNYDEDFVPLSQELEFINAYIMLEQARLGDRLQIVTDVSDCGDCLIPALILQPLVENAIRHGIFPKTGGGTVEIKCRRQEGQLVFTVKDDGVGIPHYRLQQLLSGHVKTKAGIGLANVNARLQSIFGYGLELSSKEDEGTVVTFRVPVKLPPIG